MPLYFFDIITPEPDEDLQGTELSTHDAARAYALRLASILAQESPRYLRDDLPLTIAVRSADAVVLTVRINAFDAS